jgi:hypothetical protein
MNHKLTYTEVLPRVFEFTLTVTEAKKIVGRYRIWADQPWSFDQRKEFFDRAEKCLLYRAGLIDKPLFMRVAENEEAL